MQLAFEIKGYNRIRNGLRRLVADHPKEADKAIEKFNRRQVRRLRSKRYPAKRPNQKYKRTFQLRRGWRTRQVRTGEHEIRNVMSYAPYVVGQKQAWMHKDRWWVAKDVVEEETPTLVRDLTAVYTKMWGDIHG